MSENELHVSDISEFVLEVSRLKRDWFSKEPPWGPWFRGQMDADWGLTPKIYRWLPTRRPIRIVEDEIRQEFAVRAPGLTGLTEDRPQNLWDWYFMMQHSGVPTRLLDWTEGALLALYFAVRDSDGKNDAAVWALEPWRLNEQILGEQEVIAPGLTTQFSEEDRGRYRPWLPELYDERPRLPEMPVAIYPSHIARRVSTQRSCFTIHGADVEGLEKWRRKEPRYLARIVVARSGVRDILEQLILCGVDELAVFPDVDGLGRFLTTLLRAEHVDRIQESSSAG